MKLLLHLYDLVMLLYSESRFSSQSAERFPQKFKGSSTDQLVAKVSNKLLLICHHILLYNQHTVFKADPVLWGNNGILISEAEFLLQFHVCCENMIANPSYY